MFERYADYYDELYGTKDYEKECDFLEEVFRRFARGPVESILDLGCGTGGHALPLARRGYQVTGVDGSERMLSLARRKALEQEVTGPGSLVFLQSDVKALDLGLRQAFDAAIAMFAVFSYLKSDEELAAALAAARRHLKPEALLIFDAWFGPAVLAQRPSDRFRVVQRGPERIVRLARATLDLLGQAVRVDYTLLHMANGRVRDEVKESHWQRFFFPREIKHHLQESGFRLVELCPFLRLGRRPTEKDWYFTAIAQAI